MSPFFFLQLPLDLSPLATPIIRNKIEDVAPLEAHRDSPLPHPESTTSDDKVKPGIGASDTQSNRSTGVKIRLNDRTICLFQCQPPEMMLVCEKH